MAVTDAPGRLPGPAAIPLHSAAFGVRDGHPQRSARGSLPSRSGCDRYSHVSQDRRSLAARPPNRAPSHGSDCLPAQSRAGIRVVPRGRCRVQRPCTIPQQFTARRRTTRARSEPFHWGCVVQWRREVRDVCRRSHPDQNALGRPLAIVSPLRSVDRVIVMVLAAAVGHLQDGKGGV
jgi:hypothetical protein